MKLRVPEKDIQRSILDYLAIKGHFCWRNNTGAFQFEYKGKSKYVGYGKKGSADILGVAKDGRGVAIEVKAQGNKPTPEQVNFLSEFQARGGYSILAYSLEEVIAAGL